MSTMYIINLVLINFYEVVVLSKIGTNILKTLDICILNVVRNVAQIYVIGIHFLYQAQAISIIDLLMFFKLL